MADENIINGFKNLLNCNEKINDSLLELCKPLEKFEIKYFYYLKIFKDGRRLFITNQLSFLKRVIAKGGKISLRQQTILSEQLNQLSSGKPHKFIWTGTPRDDIHEILYELDIWNGYTIYTDKNSFIEVYGVASEKNKNHLINFYLNNQELIEHFVLYFKEKYQAFISQLTEAQMLQYPIGKNENIDNLKKQINTFLSETKLEKYMLKNGVYVSRREAEAILYLSLGMQAKEIARELHLSHRTIEKYIENAKKKAAVHKKHDLINLFLESSIKLYKEDFSKSNIF